MANSYDVIVIGSGFGGAVTGCRLAEKGYKVLVLERGRRWTKDTYPSKTKRDWIWSHERPEHENGWMDLRFFPHMAVAQGAAVGGGSLIYASISVETPQSVFRPPWPKEITYQELKPYYDAVKVHERATNARNQWNPRTYLMKEGADKIDRAIGSRCLTWPCRSIKTSFSIQIIHLRRRSRKTHQRSRSGAGTCIHKGYCDIGCPVYAKHAGPELHSLGGKHGRTCAVASGYRHPVSLRRISRFI
jgi:cholesterol oxidase